MGKARRGRGGDVGSANPDLVWQRGSCWTDSNRAWYARCRGCGKGRTAASWWRQWFHGHSAQAG
eukprot:1832339-Lingulodinium_polyedra.AAC.1